MADFMDNALGILEQVAPTIASMVGGPFAGMAVSGIEKVFGLQPTGDQQAAMQAIAGATPDQLLALKKADNDFAVQMKQLDVDVTRAQLADVQSARAMQIATREWTPALIAMTTFVGFFTVLGWIALGKMPVGGSGTEAFTLLLGSLGTILTQIVAYYFGSSSGSAKKDETIKTLAQS